MTVKTLAKDRVNRHLIIPDTQVRPGVDLRHFRWIGKFISEKGLDKIIHLGDFRDMSSLSSYDGPKRKAWEHRCKGEDIECGNDALQLFEKGLGGHKPKTKILLRGNHDGWNEHGRIGRYLNEFPEDRGVFKKSLFREYGDAWQIHEFLEIVELDGILYSHLFPFNLRGKTSSNAIKYGAATPEVQVRAVLQSATAGHRPGLEVGFHATPKGTCRGVIAGSCYLHDEPYLGPNQRYWRGILVKNDVRPGIHGNPNHYDLMEVSLEYLKRRYS